VKVADIDWNTWVPQEIATLMFVIKGGQILLIRKKRGLGAGKINGPGGRLEAGESPRECAIRETREELLIDPVNVEFAAELFFHAEDMPRIHGFVFTATNYDGTPTETEEAIPLWFSIEDIPYGEMWEDDIHWLPQVIEGCVVDAWFTFAAESMLDYKVNVRSV
jgi:8-oxo-dGTP diphosphatase|tara:strand:- start:715 stop:1206 length:492 start_codon:yes stop_codon:yes gene_type:complete